MALASDVAVGQAKIGKRHSPFANIELPMPEELPVGLPPALWEAMARQRIDAIYKSHTMTAEEKDSLLRPLSLPLTGGPLQLLEDPQGGYSGGVGTGAVLWPAAVALIESLQKEELRGQRVLELGAGLGAVGMFLARDKGCQVVMTESPESVPLLARNVSENFVNGAPEVAPLRWANEEQMDALGEFHLVVASDVTYRPDCLDDLLRTVLELLQPKGRLLLSLQDRPGESESLEAALTTCNSRRERLRLVAKHETQATVPGAAGEVETIFLYEFEKRVFEMPVISAKESSKLSSRPPAPTRAPPQSLQEIEAEFERLTGIKPTPLKASPVKAEAVAVPPAEKEKAPPLSLRERVVRDYLARGLGDFVEEADKELKERLEAENPELKSKPGIGLQRLPKNAAELVAAAEEAWPPATPSQPPAEKLSQAQEKERKTAGAEALTCLAGLEWEVDLEEGQLCATVTFSEPLWVTLRGAAHHGAGGGELFKRAVGFELAERELRVLHASVAVLELRLPMAVDAQAASAKISSQRRRVTVKVPCLTSMPTLDE